MTMSGGHVTAEWIAAYLDGGLSSVDRTHLEQHLLVCADCRKDLADASELTPRDGRRWLVGGGVSAALAAAAAVLVWLGGLNGSDSRIDPAVFRSGADVIEVTVLTPGAGETASQDSLLFAWSPVAEDAYYAFTLTDARGDVLFRQDQSDTILVLPRSVGLQGGEDYFWVVDALLDGARTATSRFHRFRVE